MFGNPYNLQDNGMNYNYSPYTYKPPYNPYNFNQPQFITKQVSSIDEAKAYIIDGINTYLFVDYQNGRIYMKRMNNNGQSEFYPFIVEQPMQQEQKSNPLDEINVRLANIEKRLGGINVSNESVSDDGKSHADDGATGRKANATKQSTTV